VAPIEMTVWKRVFHVVLIRPICALNLMHNKSSYLLWIL